jgi:carboxyl-terminal processing protease
VVGIVACAVLAPCRGTPAHGAISSVPSCFQPKTDQQVQAALGAHRRVTDVTIVEEAYDCLFAHHPESPLLNDQVLLQGAMVGMISYLQQRGLDQATAVLPALAGDRRADWQAFRRTFIRVATHLPRTSALQQGLAAAAINGLVASLQDDHAAYVPPSGVSFTAPGQP